MNESTTPHQNTITAFTPNYARVPHLIHAGPAEVSHTHLLLHAVQREDYKYYPRHREREDEEVLHPRGVTPHSVDRHLKGPDRSRNAIRTSDTCQCPCVVTQVVVVGRDREGGQGSRGLSTARGTCRMQKARFMTYHDRRERRVPGETSNWFSGLFCVTPSSYTKFNFPNTWELLYQGKCTLRPFNRDLCPEAAH